MQRPRGSRRSARASPSRSRNPAARLEELGRVPRPANLGGRMPRRMALLVAPILLVALIPLTSRASAGQCVEKAGPVGAPFVDCSGGGVFNIVPPGNNGLVNLTDFLQQEAGTSAIPAHQQDQEAMYANLLKVAPHLNPADLTKYYKDASFMSIAAQAERVEQPRQGAVILW